MFRVSGSFHSKGSAELRLYKLGFQRKQAATFCNEMSQWRMSAAGMVLPLFPCNVVFEVTQSSQEHKKQVMKIPNQPTKQLTHTPLHGWTGYLAGVDPAADAHLPQECGDWLRTTHNND